MKLLLKTGMTSSRKRLMSSHLGIEIAEIPDFAPQCGHVIVKCLSKMDVTSLF